MLGMALILLAWLGLARGPQAHFLPGRGRKRKPRLALYARGDLHKRWASRIPGRPSVVAVTSPRQDGWKGRSR